MQEVGFEKHAARTLAASHNFQLQLGQHANQTLFTSLPTLDQGRRNNSFL